MILEFPNRSSTTLEEPLLDLDTIAAQYEAGEARQTVEALKRYIPCHEEDDLAWTLLAHAYLDLERTADAERAYSVALELNPDRFEALTGLGILARRIGDGRRAFHCYLRALHLKPDYAPAYSSLAVLELQRGRDEQALDRARRAHRLDPTNATINANLAVAYHYNGCLEQRDEQARRAAELGYSDMERLGRIFSGELTVRAGREPLFR